MRLVIISNCKKLKVLYSKFFYSFSCSSLVRPYHTLLFLVDEESLLAILPGDCSPALTRLIRRASPLKRSVQKLYCCKVEILVYVYANILQVSMYRGFTWERIQFLRGKRFFNSSGARDSIVVPSNMAAFTSSCKTSIANKLSVISAIFSLT
jgi:hypothetical protein